MRTGLTISAVAHGAFLVWSIFTLVAKPFENKVLEMSPVDIVSSSEFSKMTKGVKTAKKPDPKPLVEKVAEEKPTEDITQKITEKKTITPTASEPPPPQAEAKPEKKQEKAEAKPDQIAEALKKEQKKPPEKKVEAKPPQLTPSQSTKPQPRFDPTRIAALLNKKEPQRQAATGANLSPVAGQGAPTGKEAQLSQSELDALRIRLSQCWNPPVGALDAQRLVAVLRIVFNPDGTVARPPELVEATASPVGPALVESAKRAVLQCQPFTMLRKETYETWKDMELVFDPKDMFRS